MLFRLIENGLVEVLVRGEKMIGVGFFLNFFLRHDTHIGVMVNVLIRHTLKQSPSLIISGIVQSRT